MTVLCSGPCSPWVYASDVDCGPCLDLDADLLNDMFAVSSDLLYEFSGQQFNSICREVVRPCGNRRRCRCWLNSGFSPFGSSGFIHDCEPISCGCTGLQAIPLGATPVTGIESVMLDGEVLDPSVYRVDEWKWLVRLDGGTWPCCQRLDLTSSEVGTFEVDFSYGRPAPAPGVLAAKTLGCELALSCGTEEQAELCRLPRNIISVSRQGVSVLAQEAHGLFTRANGRPILTGLWEVDAFLAAYNPYGTTARAIVLSPDLPSEARRQDT